MRTFYLCELSKHFSIRLYFLKKKVRINDWGEIMKTTTFLGGGFMNSFQCNTQTVLQYILERGGKSTAYWLAHSCFNRLGEYLVSKDVSYSNTIACKWLEAQTKSVSVLRSYSKALRQLQDVYEVGHVRFINRTGIDLGATYEEVIDKYLSEISDIYTENHRKNIRNRCRFFFGFIQMDRNRHVLSELTYEDIRAFHDEAMTRLCKADFSMYKGSVANFLSWMSKQQLCPAGFSILLSLTKMEKAVMLNDLPEDVVDKIKHIGSQNGNAFSSDRLYEICRDFCEKLEQFGYAGTMMNSARATLRMIFLFLDMNGLHYSPALVQAWFHALGAECFGTNEKMSRRVLSLFECFVEEGSIHPEKTFVYSPLLSDQLPEWCREALSQFLNQKQREKKAASTVCMYRSAATRFCLFLVKEGITAFSQIDAGILKRFNLTDPHKTVEGKNAYNVRIRKFLFFLAENRYVENYFLGQSLPCASAPKTRIVKVLSDEERQALENYSDGDSALGLRDHAIILIGLEMGLRASDITGLKLEQIDWKQQCIRFCQQKTNVGKVLPMTVGVGNALYRYITEGRPESRSRHVFITHKAPYKKVSRNVCKRIMDKALPDKQGEGYGFHITRKTFATKSFQNGCGFSEVAGLLGHTTAETVNKYISLDEERMRLCPIPLAEAGILLKGGMRNE